MGENRTTAKSNIVGRNVPSVTNSTMNTMLNQDLADNLRFRLDDAQIQNSSVLLFTGAGVVVGSYFLQEVCCF